MRITKPRRLQPDRQCDFTPHAARSPLEFTRNGTATVWADPGGEDSPGRASDEALPPANSWTL